MNHSSYGSFIPINQPIMRQHVHNSSSMAYSGNAATAPLVHTALTGHSLPKATSQPGQTPPPDNNSNNNITTSTEFYLGDALKGFFSEGQYLGLSPFCNKIEKQSKSMSREIKQHPTLNTIWKRRQNGKGFTKRDSKIALKYINNLFLPSSSSTDPSSTVQQTVSYEGAGEAISLLTSEVNALVNRHLSFEGHKIAGREDVLAEKKFVSSMRMLKAADLCCVPCDNGFTAMSCRSTQCDEIMVVRSQRNNKPCCKSCANKKHHAPIAEARNELNRKKRTAPDSKTPLSSLNADEMKLRTQNNRNEKKRNKKRIQQLVDKLTTEVVMVNNDELRDKDAHPNHDGKQSHSSKEFISNTKKMLHHLLKKDKRKELRGMLQKLLSTAMETMIENEKSKQPNTKIDMDEVNEMVSCVVENMENMSKSVSGKGKQVRFSPTTLALATAVYNTSPATILPPSIFATC